MRVSGEGSADYVRDAKVRFMYASHRVRRRSSPVYKIKWINVFCRWRSVPKEAVSGIWHNILQVQWMSTSVSYAYIYHPSFNANAVPKDVWGSRARDSLMKIHTLLV